MIASLLKIGLCWFTGGLIAIAIVTLFHVHGPWCIIIGMPFGAAGVLVGIGWAAND